MPSELRQNERALSAHLIWPAAEASLHADRVLHPELAPLHLRHPKADARRRLVSARLSQQLDVQRGL
eukprot:4167557-Pleurochrysis_carterae.AAC.1